MAALIAQLFNHHYLFQLATALAIVAVLREAPTTTGVGLGQAPVVSSLRLMPLGLVMFMMSAVVA